MYTPAVYPYSFIKFHFSNNECAGSAKIVNLGSIDSRSPPVSVISLCSTRLRDTH